MGFQKECSLGPSGSFKTSSDLGSKSRNVTSITFYQVTQPSSGTEGGKLDSIGQWKESKELGQLPLARKLSRLTVFGNVLGSGMRLTLGRGWIVIQGMGDSNKVQSEGSRIRFKIQIQPPTYDTCPGSFLSLSLFSFVKWDLILLYRIAVDTKWDGAYEVLPRVL